MRRYFVINGRIYCKDSTRVVVKDGMIFATDEDENWITTKTGSHIKLDENGTAVSGAGGALNGKSFSASESKNDTPTEKTVKIPAIKTDAFEDFDKAEKEYEERESAWKNIFSDPKFDAAEWQDEGGLTYVISRSIKDGEWQLSYFDRNGDALGDKQANKPIDFLDRATQGSASQNVTVMYKEE